MPSNERRLQGLSVAIVGAGPSGLLLAHQLCQAGAKVRILEQRPFLRNTNSTTTSGRAYALGIGIRGRTAIQSTSPALWEAVQRVGFASDRFRLHVGPLALRLRDTSKRETEPSLLLFQSELCATLWDELKQYSGNSSFGQLNMHLGCNVTDIELESGTLRVTSQREDGTVTSRLYTSDLIVGCDGVNSVVRHAISETWPAFEATRKSLPGLFKSIQLPRVPTQLDPTAVALLIPKAGGVTAFVEPVSSGRCCVLFAGRNATDPLLAPASSSDDIAAVLTERFPLLTEPDDDDEESASTGQHSTESSLIDMAAQQLSAIATASEASSVVCNTYHYKALAVLCGDAAHATGGVSGQGVNSALQDTVKLSNALCRNADSLQRGLLEYSQQAVPEGHALYDLSFPPSPTTRLGRLLSAFRMVRDFVFRGRLGIGRPPLQTVLTTSLEPFADIRKSRQSRYKTEFPDQASWNATLETLDATAGVEPK